MKLLSFLLFTAFVSVTAAQDSAKPITYTTKAVPLRVVLDELNKQSGMNLRADDEMEEEPLILRFQSVPVKDVMDKMADVFMAEWVDHGDFKRLERSEKRVAAIKSQMFQEKVKLIKENIAAISRLHEQLPPLDAARAEKLLEEFKLLQEQRKKQRTIETDKKSFVLQNELPGSRLGVKLIQFLDPSELAAIPDNTRIVYATNPTSMQRPFPEFDPAVIDSYVSEREVFAAVVKKTKFQPGPATFFFDMDGEPLKERPKRLLATVLKTSGPSLVVSFSLQDSKGETIVQDSVNAGVDWEARFARRAAMRKGDVEVRKEGFELSPVVKELVSRSRSDGTEMRPVPGEVASRLVTPTSFDPLSFAASETILKGAALQNLNAIALVPDSFEQWAMQAANSGKTSLERLGTNLPYSMTTMSIASGWLIIKPIDPVACSAARTPRPLAESFLQQALKDGRASIDNIATLRSLVPRNSSLEIVTMSSSLLFGSLALNTFFSVSQDTSRLFGSLNEQERELARSKDGVKITFSSLSREQKEIVHDMIFQGFGDIEDLKAQPQAQPQGYYFYPERTDILFRGIPGDATIAIKDSRSDVAFPIMQLASGETYSYARQLEHLAYDVVRIKHPEVSNKSETYPPSEIKAWNGGTQRTVLVTIKIEDRYQWTDQMSEDHKWEGSGMTLDQFLAKLPKDARDRLMKQVDEYYQQLVRNRPDVDSKAQPSDSKPPARAA